MKLSALAFGLLLSASAHADIYDFEGSYRAVNETNFCKDLEVNYDAATESLTLSRMGGSYIVKKFPAINKGVVPWIKDLGDIVYRGTQVSEYDGKNTITNKVKKKWHIGVYETSSVTLKGDILTLKISGLEKDCILSK